MRLVTGDGEVVPTMVPVGVLPVTPATATATVPVEEVQRTRTSVGLAQGATLRAPVADALTGPVPVRRVLGASEVPSSGLHAPQAQVLGAVVVIKGQRLGAAVREVVPFGRVPGPTAAGLAASLLPSRRAGIPTADGR